MPEGSNHAALFEGNPTLIADHNVVEQVYAEQLARLVQPLRNALVFRAGCGVAAGMVVRDDDGRGRGKNRIFAYQSKTGNYSLLVVSITRAA